MAGEHRQSASGLGDRPVAKRSLLRSVVRVVVDHLLQAMSGNGLQGSFRHIRVGYFGVPARRVTICLGFPCDFRGFLARAL